MREKARKSAIGVDITGGKLQKMEKEKEKRKKEKWTVLEVFPVKYKGEILVT